MGVANLSQRLDWGKSKLYSCQRYEPAIIHVCQSVKPKHTWKQANARQGHGVEEVTFKTFHNQPMQCHYVHSTDNHMTLKNIP